ncbi:MULTISPECIES: GIY-YIG nuclease family protein [unclassified Variovorax]|uniref:GIY-YIG nuclease family protein n=1 Tax=unclassified Variovorax TaxID=663243 RepID=UPI000AD7AD79|nr:MULTISPECIES: GIY-YIG nuclease family protein [unclassified Variovorax]PNG56019.1 hypothetical protein CHC07_02433 [Variovorax sp. B4]PNG57443.1 hypothetical protein CHC06_02436 [Variovorax sp. B2]VTV10182.1 endonuclease II [Variovorax sp. WDL1]
MNRLLEIGFDPAGRWVLVNEALDYSLARHSTQQNILYAFVSDGQVMYVGKTVQPLARRMSGYRKPASTQSTNIRNHNSIRNLLERGSAVEILALPDNGLLHYGQFHLNLAAALEDDLIRVIDPPWNGGNVDDGIHPPATPDECARDEADVKEPLPPAVSGFTFILQPTYFTKGFFNVGVAAQDLLGQDGATIEIFLGDDPQPILGTVNRSANSNGAPRIMGGVGLRNWFQAVATVSTPMSVEVLSPTSVHLCAPVRQTDAAASALRLARTSQDAIWPRRKDFHVLTYAEEGFAPLNIYAREHGFEGATLGDFADEVNRLNEPGSLHPHAPVSAVPRSVVRDTEDPIALRDQIVAFLRANETSIHAKKLLLDFGTPRVASFVVTAIEQALAAAAPLLDEVVIVE